MLAEGITRVRFVPGTRLVVLCALGLPLALVPRVGFGLCLMFNLWLWLLAWLERTRLLRVLPRVDRDATGHWVRHGKHAVRVRMHNVDDRPLRVTVRDDVPANWRADADEHSTTLLPKSVAEWSYQVEPTQRGLQRFGDVHVRAEGRLGLGALIATYAAACEVRVYPNMRDCRRYALASQLGVLQHTGLRMHRAALGSGEFSHLREYVPGDGYRDLNWKATAKRQRPVTRVHGEERSQQVVLALDIGRWMATEQNGAAKLEHAIEAALLLAYVALHGGDRVGLVVFAADVEVFIKPGRGHAQYRKILEVLSEVRAGASHVDFRRFIEHVRARITRRSLLVIFSDLLDESQVLPLAAHAALLRTKHLPVCVAMRDTVVAAMAQDRAGNATQVYQRAAAVDLLAEREALKLKLTRAGIALVEADASELAVASLNRYIEIKQHFRI